MDFISFVSFWRRREAKRENPPPSPAFAQSARYVVYFDGPTGPLSVALDVSHPVLVCL